MKTTLTDKDLDLLTFASGVLHSNKDTIPLGHSLLDLRNRQRALADEPDAKQPQTYEAELAKDGVLPQAFKFRRRATGGVVTATFDRGNGGTAGWRTTRENGRPGEGGWYREAVVRDRLRSGAWKYIEAVPPARELYRAGPMDADNAQWQAERAAAAQGVRRGC